MSVLFHSEAVEEFNEAIEYYEDIESGLGFDFAIEIYSAIQRAVEFPKAWGVIDGEIRRTLVRRFPFGVLYSEEHEQIFVVAIMNLPYIVFWLLISNGRLLVTPLLFWSPLAKIPYPLLLSNQEIL